MNAGRARLAGLAVLVGAAAAGAAVVFRRLIRAFTLLLSGHPDYAAADHAANPHLPWLGRWFVVLVPVVAGLVYGPLVQFFAFGVRGLGVPEAMDAVAHQGGRIGLRVPVVRALASAVCIGGGGSVGREGPLVQVGAALGSAAGQLARLPAAQLRVLLCCGAAGATAATFDAPLAGMFFASELLLREFSVEAFAPLALASVTATLVGRALYGAGPAFHVPAFAAPSPSAYPFLVLLAVLAVLAGLTGVAFAHILYQVQDACDFVWRGPEWARPAVGGFLLGGLLLLLPQLYGVGYPVMETAVTGGYATAFLLALLAGKSAATCLTIGIGGTGGILAPTLFMGAMLGSAFGQAVQHLQAGQTGPAGLYGLIGMAAVFAGAARAPVTAVVALPELTGDYALVLPLMATIALAVLVSNTLSRGTVYTLKLRRRGTGNTD
ncbi:chloride channel protein [Kitasatospora sp. RB6PN24]|uniref:chloride channel protein n=1 Tax=Kitasatospora humi TaxID=2893891 RepID=UPI001E5715C3|nr:chloride channel protein [Kitasatospora humi]MCC9311411.1 chloride channel protein [Kitasatospora humi]